MGWREHIICLDGKVLSEMWKYAEQLFY